MIGIGLAIAFRVEMDSLNLTGNRLVSGITAVSAHFVAKCDISEIRMRIRCRITDLPLPRRSTARVCFNMPST